MVPMLFIAIVSALVVAVAVVAVVLRFLPPAVLEVVSRHVDAQSQAGARELDVRQRAITDQVQAANAELRELRELVGSLRREGAEQQGTVIARLEEAATTSRRVAELTGSLREALANPKARGQWGERTADDLLRVAGFIEGVNYRKQRAVPGGSTIPDFTFLLPHDRMVHMDVKFPIAGYLRHLEATTDIERQQATKEFLRDVRQRIKELTTRSYVDPTCTVDELLVFIPNESVHAFIHEHDPGLIDHALAQKVVLCSPLTLFAVLAVIRQAMDNFMVDQTSAEILDCLAGFTEQWTKLSEAIDKVGRGLETTQRAYDDLSGTRRRAVERTFAEIDELRRSQELPEGASVAELTGRRAG
jgi:DNA recombination protein RmuC